MTIEEKRNSKRSGKGVEIRRGIRGMKKRLEIRERRKRGTYIKGRGEG